MILNYSLLIIPLMMCCIPYSRYRGPIKFVQGVCSEFPDSHYKIRSFLVGLEISYGWVGRILKYFS